MDDTTINDFESALAELESIVKDLEQGNLALEQSLRLFERGVELSRYCHTRLDASRAADRGPHGAGRARPAAAGPGAGRRQGRPVTRSAAPAGEADVREYLRRQGAGIDDALERYLPAADDCPPLIVEAMRYSLFAGGKRLRPILTLAAAETVAPEGSPQRAGDALPAACAIEMIHTYSLVHDDLPAMDDDTLRRGRPTAHVAFGEGAAILAGDALLTEGVPHPGPLAGRERPRADRLQAARRRARGRGGGAPAAWSAARRWTCRRAGQVPGRHLPITDDGGLRALHGLKTGALIRAAAAAGAILGGGRDDEIDAVDAYARHLGLGFQIVDDILDVEGSDDALGKTAGKDAAAGKPTYPSILGLERSRALAREEIAAAKATLRAAGLGGRLDGIADWVLTRRH